MTMTDKPVENGTVRILAKTLKPVIKTTQGWHEVKLDIANIQSIFKQFKAHNNQNILIDKRHPEFLKGQLSKDGKAQGARINCLPTGESLSKAFSLFSPELTLHDQSTHDHWDVLYKNPGGTYAYVYTTKKIEAQRRQKYTKVQRFKEHYPQVMHKAKVALQDKDDHLALPMTTLLHTYMRVGNESYFKAHGHKGLTTLQKQDIDINKNNVTFDFIAKDGVPVTLQTNFSNEYIERLHNKLSKLDDQSFVFTTPNGVHPLTDQHFKAAFRKYCGEEFYPHIVRSFYATSQVEQFLDKHETATKDEVKQLFTEIAHKLGHRKYDKKTGEWKDSYNVTIHHYIQPELVEKVQSIIQ